MQAAFMVLGQVRHIRQMRQFLFMGHPQKVLGLENVPFFYVRFVIKAAFSL